MARAKKTKKSSGGRGSAEAIEKRKVARQLNALLAGSSRQTKLDGRTEKRRERLIKELKEGKRGKSLKPIAVVQYVNELLDIGDTIGSIKKQGVKVQKTDVTAEVTEIVERTQKAYSFRPEAWKMLGLTVDTEGNIKKSAPRKRRATKAKTTKKRSTKKK